MNNKKLFFIIFLALSLLNVNAITKRGLTPDDAIRIVKISDVLIAPDGHNVFYSKSILNWDKNKYIKSFFLTSSRGGTPIKFIGDNGGESFQFSPDGKYLSMLREVDKKTQLFIMPTSGGEALQYTNLENGIKEYKWGGNKFQIFFTANNILSKEKQKEWDKGTDAYYVDEGPNGKLPGKWSNLYMFDILLKSVSQMTNKNFIIGEFDISPDCKHIVFSAKPDNRQNFPHHSELYLLRISDKKIKQITFNKSPENYCRWSPNGKMIFYRSPSNQSFDLRNGYFWIMNPFTGEKRRLNSQNRGEVNFATWKSDGKYLIFSEVQKTNENLYQLDIKKDNVIPLIEKEGTLRVHSISKNSKNVAYSYTNFLAPPDLYVMNIETGNNSRLTKANPWIADNISLGISQVINWQSYDGTKIEGVLVLPSGFKKGDKTPLMLDIHGGPSGYFGNEFDPFFQLYAGLGYAVLGVNVRGSSGYGDEILRGLMGDVGGGEYDDLMSGVDHLIKIGYVNPKYMGVRGWSWGGVSCGWVVTHTDRFKAASSGAGVYSWQAESGPGYNYDLSLWYIGGNAWNNPEEWKNRSSLTFVRNVKTPTLLLHGSMDITSSTNQSMVFYTALRDLNVPTRFIKFPRQGHGIREPRLKRILMIEEIKWMQKYILNKPWNCPQIKNEK